MTFFYGLTMILTCFRINSVSLFFRRCVHNICGKFDGSVRHVIVLFCFTVMRNQICFKVDVSNLTAEIFIRIEHIEKKKLPLVREERGFQVRGY